jgi:hypothetical protein
VNVVAAKTDEDTMLKAWLKITGQEVKLGRAGYIPVWDGEGWRLFRNTVTIYENVENAADPVKVEQLRLNTRSLLGMFPETVPHLERLGLRVKRLLNNPIQTPDDVATWAKSTFNVGPVSEPEQIGQAQALAYDDFVMQVQTKPPVWVLPAGLRGSGNGATIEFGYKKQYGARHPFSLKAFGHPEPAEKPKRQRKPKPPTTEEPTAPSGATISVHGKALGRPRSDGLAPGSKEARRADQEKKRLYQANRRKAQREAASETTRATVTAIADAPKRFKTIARRNRSA